MWKTHPNYDHVANLFADDPLSPRVYLVVTSTDLVAGNLPIKTLVARQWQTHTHTHLSNKM